MPSSVCRRRAAEADQDVRIGKLDLALDERQADLRLVRRRRAVAGRPPRHDVGDVDLGAVEPDRRQHAVEQLAGAADERQALDVLVAARRLADEHHARLRIAVGEHQAARGGVQRAAVEAVEHGAQRRRGLARCSPPRAPPSRRRPVTAGAGGLSVGAARRGAVRRSCAESAGGRAPALRAAGAAAADRTAGAIGRRRREQIDRRLADGGVDAGLVHRRRAGRAAGL